MNNMSLESLKEEIKELASECTQKYQSECLDMSNALLTAWIIPQLPQKDLNAFYYYQTELLRTFRQRVKEELNWLNA